MLVKDNLVIEKIEQIMKFPKKNGTGSFHYAKPDMAVQWKFTPFSLVSRLLHKLLKRKHLNKLKICVILNVENVERLLLNGVDAKNIYFVSDCEERTYLAESFGLQDENIFKIKQVGKSFYLNEKDTYTMKHFDWGIINPDFGKTPELRRLAESICKKVYLICDTNHFSQRLQNFENVKEFENLGGGIFDDALVSVATSVIDSDSTSVNLKIIGGNKNTTINEIPSFVPSKNINDFKWADKIMRMNLPGFDANCGDLYTGDVISPKTKESTIPLIFTVGKENNKEFGRMLDCDMSQIQNATGFNKHKVIFSKSTMLEKIGAIKYAGPEYGCGHNCVSIICNSKKEAIETIDYLKSDKVKRLVKTLKSFGAINTKGIFKKIPNLKCSAQWN